MDTFAFTAISLIESDFIWLDFFKLINSKLNKNCSF
jgi:hypothetical protein